MTRILVTGGTGDLGSKVAARLKSHTVRIMSRSPRPQTHQGEWAQVDLGTGVGLEDSVRDVDVIVHAASDAFGDIRQSDVEGTRRLLEAARKAGVKHFLYISIVGIDQIDYPYYKVKLEIEQIVKEAGVPWSISRAVQFHTFVDRILTYMNRLPLVLPIPAGFQFQTIDTGEYADFLIPYILGNPAGCLPDVAGPKVMQMDEMARLWQKAKGQRKLIVKLPLLRELAAGFKRGYNTMPGRGIGKMTWETWLNQKYGTHPSPTRGEGRKTN